MKVFVVYDNQYIDLESAEYIVENHGNVLERIKVAEYNDKLPLFQVVDGEQIEIDL